MAERLSIELEDAALLAALNDAIAGLEEPQLLLDAIGAKLESNANERFQTKTDPGGAAWAPLRPATLSGIPGTLLERTGQLLASLTHNAGDDFVDIGTTRATKGGRWQVGMLMETGTRRMARRGILTADPETGRLGADDQADVLAIVGKFLGDAFA